jgi:uncharacterized protein (DUF362 family)
MKKGEDIPKVSLVKCANYSQSNVDKAIIKALDLAEIKIPKGKKILIKPNIVGSFPKKQNLATTNPTIIEAICKILKKNKCKIFIGESSFTNTVEAFKDSGIEKVAKKYGAKILIFEQDKLIKIKDSNAKVLKEFRISKTLKEVDLVINVPKLKTHLLTKFTGAIKNLYGVLPGGIKQKLHMKAPTVKRFGKMLIDIYQNVKPEINIMDGIMGMEGAGPTAGDPKKAGYILASKNAVSLDMASIKLIGYNLREIFYLNEALKRKVAPKKFLLVGQEKIPNLNFKKPTVRDKLARDVVRMLRTRPILVDEFKCIKCGICAKKCPTKSIDLCSYPKVNKKTCIRCFCCMEICPQHALHLKE